MPSETPVSGRLVVVATPIGNLEDVTLRALRALRECDTVLAEDTRRTRTLLTAHGIDRPIERLDDHTVNSRLERILQRLSNGSVFTLVSDAGTPLVSDPGAVLVSAALSAGITVEALPGPSAALCALILSGLAAHGFRFVGFIPREGPDRRMALTAIAHDPLPTVLYESPDRVHRTLTDLASHCSPDRRAALCRELTKHFEETWRGTLTDLAHRACDGVRGEVTLVVSGSPEPSAEDSLTTLDTALSHALSTGMKPSEAARDIARALGLKRSDVYARALHLASLNRE